MNSLADRLSQAKISELIGSVIEEGDVYRMRIDGREGVVGKDCSDTSNKYFLLVRNDSEGNS